MILPNDSIAIVRDAIRHWIVLLSSNRFEQAATEIHTLDSPCSVGLLVDAIGRYSRKYRDASANEKARFVPKITSPFDMDRHGENIVMYVNEGSAVIEYDLPVENSWSDLTAKFKLTERNEGQHELSLIDIRVL